MNSKSFMHFTPTVRKYCGALLLILAPLLANAQFRSTASDNTNHTINFRLMALERIVKDLCYIEEGKPVPVVASRSRPTAWKNFQGPESLKFYYLEDIENRSEDEEWPTPAIQFDPKTSGDWILLILERARNSSKTEYGLVPIPDDPIELKSGLRFYNLTKTKIAIKVNDTQTLIAPGEQEHLNPQPQSDSSIVMKIAASGKDQWKIVSSKIFRDKPQTRTTFFLIDDGERVRIKRFIEGVPQQI